MSDAGVVAEHHVPGLQAEADHVLWILEGRVEVIERFEDLRLEGLLRTLVTALVA